MLKNKYSLKLVSLILVFSLVFLTTFLILLFTKPSIHFSSSSGFSQHDATYISKGKIRFVVPETIDVSKTTFIPVKKEWFETGRMGKIIDIKAEPKKYLALDFTDQEYDSTVFSIYTKNWIGITFKTEVVVDYSNFLRVFFPGVKENEAPRKPIVLPYAKLRDQKYKDIFSELSAYPQYFAFNKKGIADEQPISVEEVFSKEKARGRAFLAKNDDKLSLIYDFVYEGIFKDNANKTQIIKHIDKANKTFKLLDPKAEGITIPLNTAPFYIKEFLGWYYLDKDGNRVDLEPGATFTIPDHIKYSLKLTARYKHEIYNNDLKELNKKGYFAVSYFDGVDRVYFDIVKKDFPANNYKYNKPGYEFIGWYLDEALTQPYDFSDANNKITKNITLYLKSKKSLKPDINSVEHKVTFITPSGANPLFPTYVKHGSKLNPNYSLSSILTRKLEDGGFEALDYWTIIDPVTNRDTGVKYDFDKPVIGDLILKAHMKPYKFPTIERKIQLKVYDTIQNKVLFEKTLTLRDGKIQSVDKLEISRVLNRRPGDFDTKYGKYTFDAWYVNSDKNTPFNLNNLVTTNLGNLNVYAVYNYEANNLIPDPENPTNQTTELDSRSAKVSFLSDTFNLISMQVMKKGEVFSGSLPSVSKPGYRFKYWAYYANGKVEGEFKETHKIYKNTTLYPVFEKDPNAALNQTQTKTVKIFNELLQVTEIFHVEKGSLLGLDTTRYNNNLGKYRYDFAKFAYKDGRVFNHLTTKISEDLELTVKHEKRPNSEFKEFNFKIYDPVRNKTIFEGKIAHKNGEIYAPDFDKVKQALKQTPTDFVQAHGRYQFKGWYLSDLTTQFKLEKTIDPNTKQINVFALYKYFANSDVPNPEDPSGAQNFGPDTIKVSFLSETMGL